MRLSYERLEEELPLELELEEGDDDFNDDQSYLYRVLLDYVKQLYKDGTSPQEIENFLRDRHAIEEFFHSGGYELEVQVDVVGENKSIFPNPNHHKNLGPKSRISKSKKVGISSSRTRNPALIQEPSRMRVGSSRISKILRICIYLVLLMITAFGGHIVICHVLDVNPFHYFPTLQERRCLLPAHPILMEMTRPVADCTFCKDAAANDNDVDVEGERGNGIVIEMKSVPSKAEFAKVAYLSKPVIIRGGGKNGGMPTGFDFYKLKDIFESEPGGVDAVSEECQFLPFRSPFTSLKEAFDKISENLSWVEPWYIGWSNCHPGVASKLRELFPRPDFLPDDSSSSAIDWIFIGSPGLGASMHIDYVKRPSWQAQLSGIKRWMLHPPPECESECPESVTFTIYPGDLLFLETNTWYHETFIDSDSLSISIGSEYD